ncbi:hypothetical protein GGR55DRAFT_339258 [Xylaria sp. FL0064]|nr:hypothetical protein GGR55DRAFT_339258 [Xylaria sp. FL0064]
MIIFRRHHQRCACSTLEQELPVLILGRVLGGVALALLWTAFESWLIAEYNERGFAQSKLSLSSLFGVMTTSKCITAIFAGVLGHCVVLALGSKIHPFILGVALDLSAAVLMLRTWKENWGTISSIERDKEDGKGDDKAAEVQEYPASDRTAESMWDLRVWAMSFVTCCFDGTIFLFMFFWPETLQDAHDRGHPDQKDTIPHGVIFASFMAIMVLGALSFNLAVADPSGSYQGPTRYTSTPTQLLMGALVSSAVCFLAGAFVREEVGLFTSFLLLEVCNGIYVPSVAYHRGTIVTDESRARVYSLMNVPLFLFVIIALQTANGTGADSGGRWQPVFLICAVLLLLAALVTSLYLHVGNNTPKGFVEIPGRDSAIFDADRFTPVDVGWAELDPAVREDVA